MVNRNEMAHGLPSVPEMLEINSCPYFPGDPDVLSYTGVEPGEAVKPGTELRILCVGDSITVGFLSDQDGGDGNGYRLQLRNDLSSKSSEYYGSNTFLADILFTTEDKVVFAGTENSGSMDDGYYVRFLSLCGVDCRIGGTECSLTNNMETSGSLVRQDHPVYLGPHRRIPGPATQHNPHRRRHQRHEPQLRHLHRGQRPSRRRR